LLYEALGVIQRNSQPSNQTEALIALLPYLPERPKEEIAQRALNQILSLKNEYMRARGIMTLAAHLPLSLLHEALQKARLLKDHFSRSQALTEIALRLTDEWRGKVLHEALESAEEIDDDLESVEALTKLAPHLPESLLRRALRAAQAVKEQDISFAEALEGLAPFLSKALLHESLKAVRKIKNKFDQIDALAVLVVHLPAKLKEEVQQEILQTISTMDREYDKVKPLLRLAASLSGKEQVAICSQVLNAARMITDDSYYKAEILT
jgi:hypothetical protein